MALAPYGYAFEKLLGAMKIMATRTGSRQERLSRAGKQYILPIHSPKRHLLPVDLAASLDVLCRDLTSIPHPTEWDDAFEAAARTMPWEKAERLADQLFIVVVELRRAAP